MRQTAALLVVIACVGAEGIAFQARGGAAQTKPGGACSMINKELVKKVSGSVNKYVFDLPLEEEPAGKGTACSYADLLLQIDAFTPAAIDGIYKSAPKEWAPIEGIGDAAYFRNNKNTYAEIIGRAGSRTFTIQLGVPFQSSVEKIKPNAVTLAKDVASRLR